MKVPGSCPADAALTALAMNDSNPDLPERHTLHPLPAVEGEQCIWYDDELMQQIGEGEEKQGEEDGREV